MRLLSFPLPLTLLASLAGGQSFVTVAPGDAAIDMSTDGNLILVSGFSDWAVIDVAAGTRTVLAPGGDFPVAISDVGLVLGDIPHPALGADTSGILTGGTWVSLGTMGGATSGCPDLSNPYDLSDSGQVAVGLGWNGCTARAYRWTGATGMVQLPQIGPNATRANVVSGDGSTIGGWDEDVTGPRRASIWYSDGSELLVGITPANPTGLGEVWGLSTDGTWACGSGSASTSSFRFSQATGTLELGLPAPLGIFDVAQANGISDDGKVIVGTQGSFFGTPPRAFIWTAAGGISWLDNYLIGLGLTLPPGVTLSNAAGISPDGTTILGTYDTGAFTPQSTFLAQIPAPAAWSQYETGLPAPHVLDLDGGGSSAIGQTFQAVTSNVTGTIVGTGLSLGSSAFPLFGGFGLIDPGTLIGAPLVSFPAAGTATASIPVPATPSLVGTDVYMQSIADDTVQPQGFALSNGLRVTICP